MEIFPSARLGMDLARGKFLGHVNEGRFKHFISYPIPFTVNVKSPILLLQESIRSKRS